MRQNQLLGQGEKHSRQREQKDRRRCENIPGRKKSNAKMSEIEVRVVPLRNRQTLADAQIKVKWKESKLDRWAGLS